MKFLISHNGYILKSVHSITITFTVAQVPLGDVSYHITANTVKSVTTTVREQLMALARQMVNIAIKPLISRGT
jgi:hypothetical protein